MKKNKATKFDRQLTLQKKGDRNIIHSTADTINMGDTHVTNHYYPAKLPISLEPNFKSLLLNTLIQQYCRYYTSRFITEDKSHEDYYVGLKLRRYRSGKGNGLLINCSDEKVLTKADKLIYVQGEAGSGKTTWCLQKAKNWAKYMRGEAPPFWNEYDWVIFLPLQELQAKWIKLQKKDQQLTPAMLWKLAIDDHNITEEKLHVFLSQGGAKNVLYLLDALDEVEVKEKFIKCLQGILNWGTFLFTSRPQPFLLPDKVDAEIILEGFSPTERNKYVKDYLGDERLKEFHKILEKFSDLEELTSRPIVLEMLCWLIKNNSPGVLPKLKELTLTTIYQDVLMHPALQGQWFYKEKEHQEFCRGRAKKTIQRQKQARIDFVTNCAEKAWREGGEDHIQPNCIQAIYNAHQKKLSARLNDLLLSLGILRSVSPEKDIEERQWEFPHRSIQEFFVAKYYVDKFFRHDEPVNDIKMLSNDRSSLILPFMVGLLSLEEKNKEKSILYIKKILHAVRTPPKFIRTSPFRCHERLVKDLLWFKCIAEIPLIILKEIRPEELLSKPWHDFFNSRLKFMSSSAILLNCRKFIEYVRYHKKNIRLKSSFRENLIHEWIKIADAKAVMIVIENNRKLLSDTIEGKSVLHVAVERDVYFNRLPYIRAFFSNFITSEYFFVSYLFPFFLGSSYLFTTFRPFISMITVLLMAISLELFSPRSLARNSMLHALLCAVCVTLAFIIVFVDVFPSMTISKLAFQEEGGQLIINCWRDLRQNWSFIGTITTPAFVSWGSFSADLRTKALLIGGATGLCMLIGIRIASIYSIAATYLLIASSFCLSILLLRNILLHDSKDLLEKIIDAKPDLLAFEDSMGRTPSILAKQLKKQEYVTILEKKANQYKKIFSQPQANQKQTQIENTASFFNSRPKANHNTFLSRSDTAHHRFTPK